MAVYGGNHPLPFAPIRNNVDIRAVLKMVYLWMGLGLLVTTVVAAFTISNPALADLRGNMAVVIGTIVVQFGVVIAISAGMTRQWLTPGLAAGLFFGYAALTGFSLSIIVAIFEVGAITNALATTVLLFGIMSVFGYFTNMDLSKLGTYLIIGLIGIIVASIVNIFLNSSGLEFIISLLGVVIFTGLTAHDTQKIKQFSETHQVQSDGSLALKFSIYGALILYLDFINLFLFLLRLFGGGSRD